MLLIDTFVPVKLQKWSRLRWGFSVGFHLGFFCIHWTENLSLLLQAGILSQICLSEEMQPLLFLGKSPFLGKQCVF